jgi:hypothetical protein
MRQSTIIANPQRRVLNADVTPPPHERHCLRRMLSRLWRWFRRLCAQVWRWLCRYSEALLMVVLTGGTFAAAILWTLPPDDVDTPLPAGLHVSAPAFVNDTQGWWPLTRATVAEAHDDGVGSVTPRVAAGTVRLQFTAEYGKPGMGDLLKSELSQNAPVSLEIDLPDSSTVVAFQDSSEELKRLNPYGPPAKTTWQVKDRPLTKDRLWYPTKRYLAVQSVVPQSTNGVTFSFDVKGVNGFIFLTNRTRVTALIPWISIYGSAPPMPRTLPTLTYEEKMLGLIRDAQKINWSVRPNLEAGDGVMFSQQSTTITQTPVAATPITGVRDDVLRADHTREIWAGILFGVAGGAFMGIFQSVFAAWRRKTTSED